MLTGLSAMKSDNFMFEAIAYFVCSSLGEGAAKSPKGPHLLQKLEV
jgi:hypothetical protein